LSKEKKGGKEDAMDQLVPSASLNGHFLYAYFSSPMNDASQ